MGDHDGIGVAAAIESLRRELTEAMTAGDYQRERLRFRLEEPVVVELQASVTWVGEGKVGWKVVEVGGSRTSADTHRITLRLTPEWWDGAQYTTDFRISGTLSSGAPAPGGQGAARPALEEGIEDD